MTPQSQTAETPHGRRGLRGLFRFLGWWLGFAGLYSAFAVCPFCGRQGCPVGMASVGSVGAFFALCMQDWRRAIVFLKSRLSVRKENRTDSVSACCADCSHEAHHSHEK
ncbi:hypothetical protein GX411_01500 [Candidatus Fermentibacteria bacterium]|nr:hypothetical protein [Candidatus Fermentibacteria bacterium]